MKKSFPTFARILLVFFLTLTLGGYLAWTRVPDYLSSMMSKKLDVLVQISNIFLTPKTIIVQKLHIGNPSGYHLAEAFSVQEIKSKALLNEYFKENIVIETLTLDNIYLGLEFDSIKGTDGNWTKLFADLEKNSANATEKSSAKRTLLIKEIIFTNVSVDILYKDQNKGVIHLSKIDEIRFTNVSSEGGLPMDQLMRSVLGQMLKEIFVRENLKNMLNNLLSPAQPLDKLQELITPFKGIFR